MPGAPNETKQSETSSLGDTSEKRPEPPKATYEELTAARNNIYTPEEKTKAWSNVAGTVQVYSNEMIKRWMLETDAYLLFAGLFSAVLTAFNVQVYPLLRPVVLDPSIPILLQISAQLASLSAADSVPQRPSISDPPDADSTLGSVPGWAIWLNALLFSGLVLSLAAAFVCIISKQWFNEYSSGISGSSRQAARVRQHRLDNLKVWHVGDIVDVIPILLQLGLACFLTAILILLWNLHDTVAAVASTLVGLLVIFTLIITILPLLNRNCTYLSPQVRGLRSIWQPKYLAFWSCASVSSLCEAAAEFFCRIGPHCPSPFALLIPSIEKTFRYLRSRIAMPDSSSWKERKTTWQGRERSDVRANKVDLDKRILLEAYNLTLHPDALSAATVCLTDYDDDFVCDYFTGLHSTAREHFGPTVDTQDGPLGLGNQHQLLWIHVLLCTSGRDGSSLPADKANALAVYFASGGWASNMQVSDTKWALSAVEYLMEECGDTGVGGLSCLEEDLLSEERSALLRVISSQIGAEVSKSVFAEAAILAYARVRRSEKLLARGTSYDAQAAHTAYFKRVAWFLQCANQAMVSSGPSPMQADDRVETVRSYAQDVLNHLIHTLLDFMQQTPQTIDVKTLENVMDRLSWRGPDDCMALIRCIPRGLATDIERLTEALEASDYGARSQSDESSIWWIQLDARRLRTKFFTMYKELDAKTAAQDPPEPSAINIPESQDVALQSGDLISPADDSEKAPDRDFKLLSGQASSNAPPTSSPTSLVP